MKQYVVVLVINSRCKRTPRLAYVSGDTRGTVSLSRSLKSEVLTKYSRCEIAGVVTNNTEYRTFISVLDIIMMYNLIRRMIKPI